MGPNPPKRQAPKLERSVMRWLLESDPSIRWQVMRDLTGASTEEFAAERSRVATEGVGARLRPPPRAHRSSLASSASGSKGQNQATTL